MANLSAIKLPNGTTYNLKDSVSGYTTNTGTITRVKTTAGAHTAIDVTSGAASFNVPTHTSHLTNDSGFLTNSTLYEGRLNWGNINLSGNVTPIGMSLSAEHSANRIAYLNPAAVSIEYTTNGGSTWTDSGYTNDEKMWLCTGNTGIAVGQSRSGYSQSTALTTNHWTRITLTGQNGTTGYVYTSPRKLLINIGSALGLNCVVEYKTGVSGASWQTFGTYAVSGWSGWNDIPLILGTFGGGTNQTSNNWYLRFTFKVTSTRTDQYKGYAQVLGLRLFGATDWGSASANNGKGPFSSTGHIYSYDAAANATFPAKVTASGGFSGNLTGNVTGNVSGTAGGVAWANVSGKPTATGSKATGISIANHGTTSVGSASNWSAGTLPTLGTAIKVQSKKSGGNGTAPSWSFTDVTVPIRADSDTTVPVAASSATACDDITAWSAGSGSYSHSGFSGGSGTFKATVTNHVLAFEHTHSAAVYGTDSHTHTAPSLSYTARSITGVSGSTTVRGVKTGTSSTTTASKASGSNGSASTWAFEEISIPNVTGVGTLPSLTVTSTSVVNGATHSITDNGHTHSI